MRFRRMGKWPFFSSQRPCRTSMIALGVLLSSLVLIRRVWLRLLRRRKKRFLRLLSLKTWSGLSARLIPKVSSRTSLRRLFIILGGNRLLIEDLRRLLVLLLLCELSISLLLLVCVSSISLLKELLSPGLFHLNTINNFTNLRESSISLSVSFSLQLVIWGRFLSRGLLISMSSSRLWWFGATKS